MAKDEPRHIRDILEFLGVMLGPDGRHLRPNILSRKDFVDFLVRAITRELLASSFLENLGEL